MITIKLVGGLGNQLFGYALGRSLGLTQEVQFDISGFARDNKRKYNLDKLGLQLSLGVGKGHGIHESSLKFDPAILRVAEEKGDAILHGYWQNERYFKRARTRILSEVFVGMGRSEATREYADRIHSDGKNTVFIHIRRTDYLIEPHRSFHGILSNDYYLDAVSSLQRKNPDLKFYVFSDDKEFAKSLLLDCTVVENTNEFEDLYLMSLCQNAIVANSSYSWWGAYLGPDQRGIVIAPEYWFKNEEMRAQSEDLVPVRWVRLAN